MTEKEVLLAAFDDAWSHTWESFDTVAKDLTEDEIHFQHPVYASEKQEDGWPKPGSILWHLVHIEYWYNYYLACLDHIPEGTSTLPHVNAEWTLEAAMAKLLRTRATLREKIVLLGDAQLDTKYTKSNMPVGEFIRMMARHDTYHTAQIAVARRLYRMRDNTPTI